MGRVWPCHALSSSMPMARFSTCMPPSAAGPDAERFSEVWRAKQLEYTWTLTLAGRYLDFWTLTERALGLAFARFPSVDKALKPKLLGAYLTLDAFPHARPIPPGLYARAQ